MNEQLISFETAKLAKEKQFQEYTSYFYTIENGLCSIDTDGEILNIYNDDLTFKDNIWDCNGDFWYNEIEDEEGIYAQTYEPIKYSAPTQSLLQKWLREKYFLHIVLIPTVTGDMTYKIVDIQCDPQHEIERPPYNDVCAYDFTTYEEALENGLQEALELI